MINVLIISPSSLVYNVLNNYVSGKSLSLKYCKTEREALALLAEKTFHFICVSRQLEDADGISLSKRIRLLKNYSHIPVVLLTSEASESLYIEAISEGCTDVFNNHDLSELISFIQRYCYHQKNLDGKILYVEDSLSQQQVLCEMLRQKGLQVDAFASAEAGYQAFEKQQYDLIITDIVLSGAMSGKDFISKIRRYDDTRGETPVLALTAFDDISRRIDLFYLGINDYIIKPVVEEELLARVRNLISNEQYRRETLQLRHLAEQASEAKSNFISRMSHELRTPLNAILGFAQLIKIEADNLTATQKQNLGEIYQAGKHLLELINDILDLAKLDANKIHVDTTEVELGPVITQCISLVRPAAEKRQISIIDNVSEMSAQVLADEMRLKQVILNLLSNAVKYNREKGKIVINGKKLQQGGFRLCIQDTGIGISEAGLEKLFLPFERVDDKKQVEGTGIGLVITKNLLKLMGGSIHVDTSLGEGSTFCIELKT